LLRLLHINSPTCADAEIGGFGGEVDLEQAGYAGGPIMVGAIDGVGTKARNRPSNGETRHSRQSIWWP